MHRITRALAAALLLTSTGCGDDGPSGTAIGCEWLTQDNCFKQSVAAAYACVESAPMGTFNADRSRCEADDGTAYAFATPPPVGVENGALWDFEIEKDGAFCAGVHETDDGLIVETSLGEFRQESEGYDVIFVCPDGARYTIGAFDALECGLGGLPGYQTSWTSSAVTFDLTTSEADGRLVDCVDP